MLGKKVTFLILPQGTNKVKRYTLPRYFPTLGILCLLIITGCAVGYAVYAHKELNRINRQTADVERLCRRTVQQDIQIHAFADKIKLLEQEMARLRQYDLKLRAMTAKAPTAKDAALTGMGGSDSGAAGPALSLKANTKSLVRRMHKDLDRLLAEAGVQETNQHRLGRLFEDTKSIMASTPDSWPLSGPITSFFGYRKNPFGGRSSEFHRGLDISAPNGAPITAPADGRVVSVDWNSGYGMILVLNHGYGLVTRYAHISEAFVEAGQRVKRGEKICAVGATGRVTGPHLHYETILNGIPVNPMQYLEAKK